MFPAQASQCHLRSLPTKISNVHFLRHWRTKVPQSSAATHAGVGSFRRAAGRFDVADQPQGPASEGTFWGPRRAVSKLPKRRLIREGYWVRRRHPCKPPILSRMGKDKVSVGRRSYSIPSYKSICGKCSGKPVGMIDDAARFCYQPTCKYILRGSVFRIMGTGA